MPDLLPIGNFHLTAHARFEMERRQVNESLVATVLSAPEQIELVSPGRAVYQSRFTDDKSSRTYLLRVFVDIDRSPPEIVTVYRTTKIEKYWRG